MSARRRREIRLDVNVLRLPDVVWQALSQVATRDAVLERKDAPIGDWQRQRRQWPTRVAAHDTDDDRGR